MTSTYSITVTNEATPRITLATIDFAGSEAVAVPFDDLSALSTDQAAVIYIVSHAVPNALKVGNRFVPEAELVMRLAEQRKGLPTLVILDTCFAESFADIPGLEWPPHFGRIFSCRAFERSWHTGAPERQSLFSGALNWAMRSCIANRCSATLERNLRERLGDLQQAVVDDSAYEFLERVLALPRTKLPSKLASQLTS